MGKLAESLPLLAEVELKNCEQHGEFQSRRFSVGGASGWSTCPACLEDQGRKNAEEQERQRQAAASAGAVRNATIPPRFASRTLENYEAKLPGQQRALEVAKVYADSFTEALETGRSLIFCGTAGTGKTHLAVGIAHQVIAAGYSAAFTTAMDAIRTVRETYSKTSQQTEREVIRRFAKPDLTIIDEVGSQLGTDAEKVTLFDLINARYEAMRPMIVMSNLTVSEVEQYMGSRAFDRIRENGGQAVTFTWASYRRAK